MHVIKRIDVWSAAKIAALVGAVIGLIAGVLFALFGGAASLIASSVGVSSAGRWAGYGLLSIVIMPIGYAISGFIGGVVLAFVYNLCANWIGGVKVDW